MINYKSQKALLTSRFVVKSSKNALFITIITLGVFSRTDTYVFLENVIKASYALKTAFKRRGGYGLARKNKEFSLFYAKLAYVIVDALAGVFLEQRRDLRTGNKYCLCNSGYIDIFLVMTVDKLRYFKKQPSFLHNVRLAVGGNCKIAFEQEINGGCDMSGKGILIHRFGVSLPLDHSKKTVKILAKALYFPDLFGRDVRFKNKMCVAGGNEHLMRKLKNAYLRVVRLNYKLVDYLLFYTYYVTDSCGEKLSVNEKLALTAQNPADLISLVPMK